MTRTCFILIAFFMIVSSVAYAEKPYEPKQGQPYGIVSIPKNLYVTSIDGHSTKGFLSRGITNNELKISTGTHELMVAYSDGFRKSVTDTKVSVKVEEGVKYILGIKWADYVGSSYHIVIDEEIIVTYGTPEEIQKRKEKVDFKKALKMDNIEMYEEYLKQYPNSELAQKAEEKIYEKILGRDNVKIYREFLKRYPKSKFAQNTDERITAFNKRLQEAILLLPGDEVELTLADEHMPRDFSEGTISIDFDYKGVSVNYKWAAGGVIVFDKKGNIKAFAADTIVLSDWSGIMINGKEIILAGEKGATLKRIKGSKKIKCTEGEAYVFPTKIGEL